LAKTDPRSSRTVSLRQLSFVYYSNLKAVKCDSVIASRR